MSDELVVPKFVNMHCHLRRGEMLRNVLPYTAAHSAIILPMPNTNPHIANHADVSTYFVEILNALNALGDEETQLLMTMKMTDDTTPDDVDHASGTGVFGVKIYPEGKDSTGGELTTGAAKGLTDFFAPRALACYAMMVKRGLKLLLHAELPEASPQLAEAYFIPTLLRLHELFPDLQISVEHVSCALMVGAIKKLPSHIVGTITPQHLLFTRAEALGNVHLKCKPIMKTVADREALWQVIAEGNPKFFWGPDCAPHLRTAKEALLWDKAPNGCFSAPIQPELLATMFSERHLEERLADFTSGFACRRYGLTVPKETITLVREPLKVAYEYGGVVPILAGQTLPWRRK